MQIKLRGDGFTILKRGTTLSVSAEKETVYFTMLSESGDVVSSCVNQNLIHRLVGAVSCSGYKIDGFRKEVINDLYIETDRVRIRKTDGDRLFVKLTPSDYLMLFFYLMDSVSYPSTIVLGTPKKQMVLSRNPMGVELTFPSGNSILLSGFQLIKLRSLFVGFIFGLVWDPQNLPVNSCFLTVNEVVEPDPSWKKENADTVARVKINAREKGYNPLEALRRYLKAIGIPYSRKISFSMDDEAVLLPLPDAAFIALSGVLSPAGIS